MKKTFNAEAYKATLAEQIEILKAELNAKEIVRREAYKAGVSSYAMIKEIQDLKDKIINAELLMNPQFVTEVCYTDRHAYKVIEMVNEKTLVAKRLTATRVDNNGMSESQRYEFSLNPDANEITLRLHKNGWWCEAGNCNPFRLEEEPYEYFDFSF